MSDTVELLREVDSGCLMALNSIHQVQEYSMSDGMAKALQKYVTEHKEIGDKASQMLKEMGEPEKRPHPIATAMSWITTEMKMMIKDDNTQIAKLMMDGCNMGIQGIGEKISQFQQASDESVKLARKLIQVEEKMLSEIKEYL